MKYNPQIITITNLEDARKRIQDIGCDPKSIDIMAPKMISKVIKVKNVLLQDAIIIKQDMLSIGGEVAIPKDSFELKERYADILIIGTLKQQYELIEKLKRHYARIKQVAQELKETLAMIQ